MKLEQSSVPMLMQGLQVRVDFWRSRARACQDLGVPEMVVARTKRFANLSNPQNIVDFKEADLKFRNEVMHYLRSQFGAFEGVQNALELFVGAGVFYRELEKFIPGLLGVDFVPENLDYIQNITPSAEKKLFCMPAHWIDDAGIWTPNSFDMVLAFRGFIHQPFTERVQTLREVQRILKPEGFLVVGEMFEDDRPRDRRVNRGTWYWRLIRYQNLLEQMDLIGWSNIIDNDGDPCRVVLFKKR